MQNQKEEEHQCKAYEKEKEKKGRMPAMKKTNASHETCL
jgi:hypothetical protein